MSAPLVSVDNPGEGILVDAGLGRAIGDTSSGSVYLSDLPTNFHGGDEALHFALGELFAQYGKIKKIELYYEDGMLDTKDFKGDALVVFHPTKKTGTRDKGDPVWESCKDMDGKWRMLGKKGWRMTMEPAQWQKQGYDVKSKAKVVPCVEIGNLWDYDPNRPLSWFSEIQEGIRQFASEHVENPFVKVDPSDGVATIWCKGAQETMKLASFMHKMNFMGRKVVASMCRKEKPLFEKRLQVPVGELTMNLPNTVWDGSGTVPGVAGQGAEGPDPPQEAAEEEGGAAAIGPVFAPGPPPRLEKGEHARLVDLVSKPENNGKLVKVVDFVEDLGKYQAMMPDGKAVKVKPENLARLTDDELIALFPKRRKKQRGVHGGDFYEDFREDDDEDEEDEAKAAAAASRLAGGEVRAITMMAHDPKRDGFLPGVCVDPALLPRRPEEVSEELPFERRERSRSRQRRQADRAEEVQARLSGETCGPRPAWAMASPEEMAATLQCKGKPGVSAGTAPPKVPEESREELMQMSVGKLKAMLTEFGKSARGCIEKRDFVDRLRPPTT